MPEVRFYHLVRQTLESVLPVMLTRTLERGGRAVVQGPEAERLEALDRLLWIFDEASFLPHARAGVAPGEPGDHPIWLTTGEERPNAPNTLFLIDGAPVDPATLGQIETTAILFDGNDAAATEAARQAWRMVTSAGLRAVYWAEDPAKGWVRQAESAPGQS
ncbi:MAG: DNA polymerase III subunit chi [Pseudomonadota bacterium]